MESTARAARQFHKVIGLKDHIIEFEESERLLPIKAQLDRIKRQHAVDREMAANVAQQFDIAQLIEPICVIDHDCIGRAVAKGQEALKNPADGGDIAVDSIGIEHLADFILAGWIPHLGRPTAEQNNRLMSGLLQATQQHDRHKITDMKRGGCCIKSHITRHNGVRRQLIERIGVRNLVDVAAIGEGAEQV